jgi:hypothetical protein
MWSRARAAAECYLIDVQHTAVGESTDDRTLRISVEKARLRQMPGIFDIAYSNAQLTGIADKQ